MGQAVQQLVPGLPTSRHLAGDVTVFDGDQTKSLKFEREFGLYRLLNANHPMIQIPMQWVALALSFIKGDKVDQWVAGQANWLAMQVYGEND